MMLLKMKLAGRDQIVAGSRVALLLLSIVPAVYVFIAIQYSAITVPFWDHTELIRWIASWYDGTFQISSLWAPHNETRPLVYRAVMLFNAMLTNWDIRSEYVYMYVAIYGTFACHLWALRRLTGAGGPLIFPTSLLLISLLIFSPAGHNNHWWSMMFQLNVANLLIAFGLLITFLNPRRWSSHVLGAASCWLAAYSLTNGLFAFLAVIATLLLTTRNPLRPDRWILFWILNFVVIMFLYMPGMHTATGIAQPGIDDLAWFSLVYLGASLGSILWFPFKSQFDLPISTVLNGLCGIMLVVSASLLIWHAKERLRNRHPAALILVGFALFAGGSALATGWGRAAFDAYGVSNANSSRYTIFSVYLLLGQIYYVSAGYVEGWLRTIPLGKRWGWRKVAATLGIAVFVVLSSITYVRAVWVYVDAHNFNRMLVNAYPWGLEPTDLDKYIHPNPDFVRQLKAELQRLQLGPYSIPRFSVEKLPIGEYKRPFSLFGNKQLAQRFRASAPGLKMLDVTMVTWGNSQVSYRVAWQLYDVTGNERSLVAKGVFDSMGVSDWQPIHLRLPYLPDSRGRLYEIEFSAQGKLGDQHAVGLPLYSMGNAQVALEPAVATGESVSERLTLALRLEYAK